MLFKQLENYSQLCDRDFANQEKNLALGTWRLELLDDFRTTFEQ